MSARKLPPLPPRGERRRRLDLAWDAYVCRGNEPDGVPTEILHSWQRARDGYRIDPKKTRSDRFLAGDALVERCSRDEVFRLATPVLAEFSRRLDLAEAALAYLDADGWMLRIGGDPRVVEQVQEIEFRPGACWSEEVVGTNGPGTALAEGRAVEVFASEHFVSACHPWSCAAAPIRAPGDPRPVGVVDITASWEVQRRHALLVAKAIAQAVEERLRAALAVRDEVVRYALRAARESGDALVAVDARGRVIGASDAAARRRLVDGGRLARRAEETVAAALRGIAAGIDGDVRVEGPGGDALIASPVRYEGAPVGAILRAPSPAAARALAAPRRAAARGRLPVRHDLEGILGQAAALRRAVDLARRAARNDLPVVISGEPGTGKELLARAIHAASARQAGPFVAVGCASTSPDPLRPAERGRGGIPASLLEIELFGAEAATLTDGPAGGRPGRFEEAAGGTVFLDEVAELPQTAQVALLRVLQDAEVVRVGGSVARPLDVRVLAASARDLEGEVRAGRFRRDLFYRLAVLPIAVPPLRERGADDVALLARAFLDEAAEELARPGLDLAPAALAALAAHAWPGNVRELRTIVLRAAATAPGLRIEAEALGLRGVPPEPGVRTTEAPLRRAVQASERAALLAALEAAAWNVVRAAEQLGVSRMTLYRRLRRHGISRAAS
jgi:transcriptional regulator of acetoin/glycerol metabolism